MKVPDELNVKTELLVGPDTSFKLKSAPNDFDFVATPAFELFAEP